MSIEKAKILIQTKIDELKIEKKEYEEYINSPDFCLEEDFETYNDFESICYQLSFLESILGELK